MVAQAVDDVAFGDDAGDPAAVDHRQGADSLFAEPCAPHRNASPRQRSSRPRCPCREVLPRWSWLSFRDSPLVGLIVPLRAAKGKRDAATATRSQPASLDRCSRFWRIFRLLALLSIVIAAIAVVLVDARRPARSTPLIIATALGIGSDGAARHRPDDAAVHQHIERPRRCGRKVHEESDQE